MKYYEVEQQMLYEGYEFGGLNSIDIQVCAESECEECGHKGLKFAGFKKDGSYRAWAVCPECDEELKEDKTVVDCPDCEGKGFNHDTGEYCEFCGGIGKVNKARDL